MLSTMRFTDLLTQSSSSTLDDSAMTFCSFSPSAFRMCDSAVCSSAIEAMISVIAWQRVPVPCVICGILMRRSSIIVLTAADISGAY